MTPEETVATWPWQTEEAILLQHIDGKTDAFPDDFLVRVYRQLEAERILPWLFPGENKTLVQFIAQLADKPLLVAVSKESYPCLVGIGWLDGKQGQPGARKAMLAFAFTRKFLGSPEIRAISRLALKWFYENCEVDVLFGIQAQTNRLARKFAIDLGFDEVGVIPDWLVGRDGNLAPATLMHQTKQRFLELEEPCQVAAEKSEISN